MYVEFGNQFFRFHSGGTATRNYEAAALIRVGVWSEFELRFYGAPYVNQFDRVGPAPVVQIVQRRNPRTGRVSSTRAVIPSTSDSGPTSGLSPLGIGFKKTFWKEQDDSPLPGFGLEAGTTIPMGNPAFNNGFALPYLAFNFDKSIGELFDLNITYTPGYNVGDDNNRFIQHIFHLRFARVLGGYREWCLWVVCRDD